MKVTRDSLLQMSHALKNLDSFILERIAAESRSEHERILMEGVYRSDEATNQRLRAHYSGQLTRLLKEDVVKLQQQVNADLAAAADAHDRAQTSWQNSIKRDEYAYQAARIGARVKELRTPQEAARLAATATTREQLEAVRDALPDMLAKFSDIMDRAHVHGLGTEIDTKLNALKPSTLVDSATRLQNSIDAAQAADAAMQQANEDSGGALNVELGLSIFSASPDGGVQWQPQSYQSEGAGLLG